LREHQDGQTHEPLPSAFFYGFKQAQNIKLGLRGEQVVTEALNEAMEFGFRLFQYLPAEEIWNFDHVAVGTRGVFLNYGEVADTKRVKADIVT